MARVSPNPSGIKSDMVASSTNAMVATHPGPQKRKIRRKRNNKVRTCSIFKTILLLLILLLLQLQCWFSHCYVASTYLRGCSYFRMVQTPSLTLDIKNQFLACTCTPYPFFTASLCNISWGCSCSCSCWDLKLLKTTFNFTIKLN